MDEFGNAPPSQPPTVGARLAAARVGLGLTLEDVAQRTRIPLRHLAAIEAGSGRGLPALTYSSGFVRTFASAVGIDPVALSRDYRQELGALPPAREVAEPWDAAAPARVPPWWLAIVALVVALVVAGGYALWRGDALFGHGGRNPAEIATSPPTGSEPTPASMAAPQPVAPPAPAAGGQVVLIANSPVWLKVSDGEKRLFLGVLDTGKSFAVPGDAADPRLRTGRPQALKVMVGGVEHAPLGKADQILREVSLRPTALGQAGSGPASGGGMTPLHEDPPASTKGATANPDPSSEPRP